MTLAPGRHLRPAHHPVASVPADPEGWSPDRSAELYGVARWGAGYFAINEEGHVTVQPRGPDGPGFDLMELVESLEARGVQVPVLLRFDDIIADRIHAIHAAFEAAIEEYSYEGTHQAVYPIKVNQQRHVVEQIYESGRRYGYGLEAGSKPELLAVMALVDNSATPIICNGFKDEEFIEAVILATKMGKNVIPVVEKFSELEAIIRYAKQYDVHPRIGMRVKLATRGSGRWESSGGARSKFGLFISETMRAVETLAAADMLDCFNLLHFHLGSQINDVRNLKSAISELTRIYAALQQMGAGLELLDVGGGLGIDYDGTKTTSEASINYDLQEYANNVVYHIQEACQSANVPTPGIITECGRAMTAYNSVLIFNVIGQTGFEPDDTQSIDMLTRKELEAKPQPIRTLYESYLYLDDAHLREYYHDAQVAYDEAMYLFNLGYCTLQDRALAERLYFGLCLKVLSAVRQMEADPPPELEDIERFLADSYFCNVSIFQSMPDSWAIDQLFPIMPIHRLDEEPNRRGTLADITCDSDGKVDRFVCEHGGPKRVLELHSFERDRPYYLAAFLVGAYQEILGDLHNLLGDTNAVHIRLDEDGEPEIDEVVEGDRVREVLSYVQFSAEELMRKMRKRVERSLRQKRISLAEANLLLRFYENGLEGYTYLE